MICAEMPIIMTFLGLILDEKMWMREEYVEKNNRVYREKIEFFQEKCVFYLEKLLKCHLLFHHNVRNNPTNE